MDTLHTSDHHITPAHDHHTSTLRITCLIICGAIPILMFAMLFWFTARSELPPTRPAIFVVQYEDYIPPASPAGGAVQVKQFFQVSSGRCYTDKPAGSDSCTVTEAELDALYRVLRANQFDTINNPWSRLLGPQCLGNRTTLITVTINQTKYIKNQPTGCTSDRRWQTVVETLRTFIEPKRLS